MLIGILFTVSLIIRVVHNGFKLRFAAISLIWEAIAFYALTVVKKRKKSKIFGT